MYLIYNVDDAPLNRCSVCLSGTPTWVIYKEREQASSCDAHLSTVIRKFRWFVEVVPYESVSDTIRV